jgi:hypothetical protein
MLILIGAVLYQTIGGTAVWRSLFAQAAHIPAPALALAAGVAGMIIGYAGWIGGRRPLPREEAVSA